MSYSNTIMSLIFCSTIVTACVFASSDAAFSSHETSAPPLLTVICVNGFRWDYLAKFNVPTPMLDYMASTGVRAKYVESIYPAKPVPNAMSMATGLFAESHGFIGDSMFDPELHEKWSTWSWPNGAVDDGNAEKSTRWFDNVAEPIWQTNAKKSSARRSGLMMWPLGAIDFPAGAWKAPRYRSYNTTVPYIDRIDQLVEWFTDARAPINLGMMYFELLETYGHNFGPNHPQIREAIFVLDAMIGYLFQRLNEVNLFDQMNVMIVSGHGMSEVKDSIVLGEHIDPSKFELIDRDQLWPKPEHTDEVEDALRKIPRLRVVAKEDLPDYLHIRNSKRTPPMMLRWDEGYVGRIHAFDPVTVKGDHGFDPAHRNMRSAFYARGPAFKKGFLLHGTDFKTVDVYPLMCRVLRLHTQPGTNGTYSHVKALIHDHYAEPEGNMADRSQRSATLAFILGVASMQLFAKLF